MINNFFINNMIGIDLNVVVNFLSRVIFVYLCFGVW